jgi:hypothetical protein
VASLRTLLIYAASECRREGDAWGGEGGKDHPSRCGLGCALGLLFLQLLRVCAAPIVGGMGFFSSRQLQHAGVDVVFPFSGHSLCRYSPPHHKQRGGCLQFAQTWPNCWQLWHCVREFWVLYVSTLIAMWQRLCRWKVSWNFAVLGKVTRKRGRFVFWTPREVIGWWLSFA